MLRHIPKVLLLVALLAALVASSAPVFGAHIHAGVTRTPEEEILCLREGVISTKALCSVSILAARELAINLL
jgi:hypothetical protein